MCFAWRLVTSIIKSRALTARAHENSLKEFIYIDLTALQRLAKVQNVYMRLTFGKELANHPKQIDCVMKFDILRAAEYNKSGTLQIVSV